MMIADRSGLPVRPHAMDEPLRIAFRVELGDLVYVQAVPVAAETIL
jgi:hypothetical protein